MNDSATPMNLAENLETIATPDKLIITSKSFFQENLSVIWAPNKALKINTNKDEEA